MSNPPTLNFWPAIITIEDCFIPELAPLVMEVCAERTEEIHQLVVTCWANEAGMDLVNHRN